MSTIQDLEDEVIRTTPPAVIVPPYPAQRRTRRQRPRGWRLKIARWLRRLADWLAPLN